MHRHDVTARWQQISTLAVDLYVGWMFLISGLIGLFTMFVASDATAFLWSLLTAALSLFVGALLSVRLPSRCADRRPSLLSFPPGSEV